MPSSQFMRLPADDQARIVRASLAAFAEDGYDLASTNRIVREAGISKGVLFKYFRDKEALFLHVVELETRDYVAGLPQATDVTIFDWIRATTAYKLRHIKERPLSYRLFVRLVKDSAHPVYARALRAQAELLQGAWGAPDWQFGTLRPGVTPEHVLHLLQWISAGLQEKFAALLPETMDERFDAAYQAIVSEFDIYLDVLKSGLYGEAPTA